MYLLNNFIVFSRINLILLFHKFIEFFHCFAHWGAFFQEKARKLLQLLEQIFFPVRMDERNVFVPFFQRYRSAKESNMYLLLKGADVANALDQPGIETFVKQMESLKAKGYKVAMILSDNTLNLDQSIYEVCDAFMVDLGDEDNAEIDTKRFRNTGCEEVDAKLNELEECIERIRNLVSKSTPVQEPSSNASSCDVKKLNAEIKSTTTKLNNLVNDWSLASDASSKAEKKAAFDSTVKSFDAKLEGLPSGCKAKLDAKLLKNYEFVKKLIK